MQETPQQSPYTVCTSYPATAPPPPPSATQGVNSPPATPGLPPQQPSTPPNPAGRMQTPHPPLHMATQSSFSQSIVSPSTTARSLMSPPELVPSFSEPNNIASVVSSTGKGGDEFMFIMQDLMHQESATTSAAAAVAGMGIHQKELEAHYLYSSSNYAQQLEGHVNSPYMPPVTSPSSASDQPCYSPITPVQSPHSASKSS